MEEAVHDWLGFPDDAISDTGSGVGRSASNGEVPDSSSLVATAFLQRYKRILTADYWRELVPFLHVTDTSSSSNISGSSSGSSSNSTCTCDGWADSGGIASSDLEDTASCVAEEGYATVHNFITTEQVQAV